MNHKNMYKETFQVIRPSEELKEKILNMENRTTGTKNGYVKRFSGMAAAIAAVVLMVGAVSFAVANHTVRNWLLTQWELYTGQSPSSGQKAEIARLSQQVDQGVTSDGVTVTVDSVTVSGENYWILCRVSEGNFDHADYVLFPNVNFVNTDNPDLCLAADCSEKMATVDDDGILYFTLQGFVEVDMVDQRIDLSDGTWIMNINLSCMGIEEFCQEFYQNGSWELEDPAYSWEFEVPISSVAEDPEQNAVLESVTVTARMRLTGEKKEVALEDIRITSAGMTYRIIGEDEDISIDSPVLILKDGTRIEVNSMSLYGDTGQKEYQGICQWIAPIDLNDVAAVYIGETEIAIH